MIAPKVQALCGKKPGRDWVYCFFSHHPEYTLEHPTGLNSKRAKAFNFLNVNAYFKRLQTVIDENQIPWENIHNLDKIDIQLSEGWKNTGELFFFSTGDKTCYKIKSDDLELTTILECVCGYGTTLVKPAVAFVGVKMCKQWFENKGVL